MGKYLLKRILYSIFSLVCVMIIMIILLFTLKDSRFVVASDDSLKRLRGNEKEYRISLLLEKYDYVEVHEYTEYINKMYSDKLTPNELKDALELPEYPEYESNEYIKSFADYYSKKGYNIIYFQAKYNSRGKLEEGYTPIVYAQKNNSVFNRLWKFFSNMVTIETVNDIDKQLDKVGETYGTKFTTGYYLVNDYSVDGSVEERYADFNKYWGSLDLKLVESKSKSSYDKNIVYYSIDVGVFEDMLNEQGSLNWNVVYYDADTKEAKLIGETQTITSVGEYTFGVEKEYDVDTKVSNFNLKLGSYTKADRTSTGTAKSETPSTRYYRGSKYPVEKKGISLIWDTYSNMPALVGDGTTHRYLVYFDNIFPYVHQNIIRLNLGTSLTGTTKGHELTQLMFSNYGQGKIVSSMQEFPAQIGTGVKESTAYNFHTATYYYQKESVLVLDPDVAKFGTRYMVCDSYFSKMSRASYSFTLGIISTIIAYFVGIPLGVLMARKKDKIADKIGMGYIIFMIAVPSLAYIYIFSSIGQKVFGLPTSFALQDKFGWTVYVLPILSLALPSIAGEMKWVRRYMIDQSNSDYVKFARSQGLSEGEIFSKHIAKNAIIPIVHGIPGAIIGCISGAYITENVYGVPGTGALMMNAINNNDNGILLGVTFFYALLSITSLILGDILLTIIDPRISFTGGRK